MIQAAAALAAAFLVAPAGAQERAPLVQSQTVTHANLNLGEARGVARFDLRIRRAARDLCGMPSTLDVAGRRKARQCEDAAVARVADARTSAIAGARATMIAGR